MNPRLKKPGLVIARVAAIGIALTATACIVVTAHDDANPPPPAETRAPAATDAPSRTAAPAANTQPESKVFLQTSKSLSAPVKLENSAPTFLLGSKSGLPHGLPAPGTSTEDGAKKKKKPGTFLPSSKSMPPHMLRKNQK